MQKSDRRAAPRFRIAIPLRFQVAKSSDPEYAAERLDVSSCGMCMETDAPPHVGAILQVRLCLRNNHWLSCAGMEHHGPCRARQVER